MDEIEISLMSYTPDRVRQLQEILSPFESKHHVRVHIHTIPWDTGWSEILKYVFQAHGPAVSEVGDTWVNSLSQMQALRPFTRGEIETIGGENAFLSAAWQPGHSIQEAAWAVPWLAEARVIIYRRDLLAAAGIDEKRAFTTHQQLVETLERLRAGGTPYPWLVSTTKTLNTLHSISNWIWEAGGDFVDANFSQVTFAERAARNGIENYYSLYRFIDPRYYGLDASAVESIFTAGQSAVTINGPWMVFPTYELAQPNVMDKIGVASMPGTPCVLASNLVIWRHAPVRDEKLAVELVKYLSSPDIQRSCAPQTGLLPARLESLDMAPYSENPFYRVFVDSLKSGRSLPSLRLWGLIEERLTSAFGNLWDKILVEPEPDLRTIIRQELTPLAQRINRNF